MNTLQLTVNGTTYTWQYTIDEDEYNGEITGETKNPQDWENAPLPEKIFLDPSIITRKRWYETHGLNNLENPETIEFIETFVNETLKQKKQYLWDHRDDFIDYIDDYESEDLDSSAVALAYVEKYW